MLRITLKAARINADLSQKEAAEQLHISNKTLCNWENGVSYPDAEQIDALCKLYGVHYDNIIFLPGDSL
jgi:transcriptional regulator with XRE-family HTH domain